MEKNNLGGNCPQERVDRIKQAWLDRYYANESDWDTFAPVTQVSVSAPDDENQSVTLCPTPEELCFRYTARARYHFRLARQYKRTPKGFSHYNDGLFYTALAHKEWNRHTHIISLIRGGV